MNTIERVNKLTPNKQSLLALWLDQRSNGATSDAADADKQLVAYVVMKDGATGKAAQLREYLKGRAPGYMVPDTFVPLDSLPLTINGKIDRQRLSELSRTARSVDDKYVAPRTELEEELAAIWGEILKVERVGIHDNFFDLGGHSLLATRLIFQLREHFQVELPLRTLFEAPTIASLAPAIVQSQLEQVGGEQLAEVLTALEQS
ncbi:MAG TPA: phosphopantetheine-binding protein [Pyrinomonadaceae bacterium]|jgi:acyl carrier protein|nr:phosphopantetheine-binding protein [Pyrinomonadaceae bacterium]